MSTDNRDERLARRMADLCATDPQFADARPNEAITATINRPGVRMPELVRTVMEGYADRPRSANARCTSSPTRRRDRTSIPTAAPIRHHYLPRSVGPRRSDRGALADDPAHPVRPGDRVAILGFASVDYTTVDLALIQLGAVSVPLQTSAPLAQLQPIVAETEPTVLAASIDHLADAVELVLTGHAPARLVLFDYHPQVDEQREAFDAATARLADAGSPVIVETLADVLDRGKALPTAPTFVSGEDDPLALLIYTSGSTGAPKGAMYPGHCRQVLRRLPGRGGPARRRAVDHALLHADEPRDGAVDPDGSLGAGGTAYFAAKSDLRPLLEDLALVRPTQFDFVPRIWEMLFEEFQSELDRRSSDGADRAALEAEVMAELRRNLLGGRFVSAVTASAPISAEMKAWAESCSTCICEGYGSTEDGVVFVDGLVRRPPVIDYKLVDVPDLGYFHTDRPHPRGELLVKSETLIPGYYKRPEVTAEVFDADGYYRTGDIVAETGPDQLVYVDRRNNVLKLAQGEFVTVSKLEAVFGDSPLVRDIYIYGNSARSYLLAVVVPTEEALSRHDVESLKPLISDSLQKVAKAAALQSYEIPRDFIVETTPFTLENGLLTGIRKLARPKLKERYGQRLEQLYAELAESQTNELRALRRGGAGAPVLQTISRAAGALLGAGPAICVPTRTSPTWAEIRCRR